MNEVVTVKKDRYYMCIMDWHKTGSSFTEGKVYKCHKDRCMYDDHHSEKASVDMLFRLATKDEIREHKKMLKLQSCGIRTTKFLKTW